VGGQWAGRRRRLGRSPWSTRGRKRTMGCVPARRPWGCRAGGGGGARRLPPSGQQRRSASGCRHCEGSPTAWRHGTQELAPTDGPRGRHARSPLLAGCRLAWPSTCFVRWPIFWPSIRWRPGSVTPWSSGRRPAWSPRSPRGTTRCTSWPPKLAPALGCGVHGHPQAGWKPRRWRRFVLAEIIDQLGLPPGNGQPDPLVPAARSAKPWPPHREVDMVSITGSTGGGDPGRPAGGGPR